jgi:hypothetical protein
MLVRIQSSALLTYLINQYDSRVCWTAWQSSKLSDQVRFLGGLLALKNELLLKMFSGCAG